MQYFQAARQLLDQVMKLLLHHAPNISSYGISF